MSDHPNPTAAGYAATKQVQYFYPGAGDQLPPPGAKVTLLTVGGIQVTGQWKDDGSFLGWYYLIGRDHDKETIAAARHATKALPHRR